MADDKEVDVASFFIGGLIGLLVGMILFVLIFITTDAGVYLTAQEGGFTIRDADAGVTYVTTDDEQACETFLKILEGRR